LFQSLINTNYTLSYVYTVSVNTTILTALMFLCFPDGQSIGH